MSKLKTYTIGKVVLWSSLLLFLFSCAENRDTKICKVGDQILYETELNDRISLLLGDFSDEEAKEKVIEEWINQQQVALEIEKSSPEVKTANEMRVQDELMQLNLFELENIFITENLDSIISNQEIQKYYNSHRENYKAESFIVRALYIKIPDTLAPMLNIDKHFLLKNDKDLKEIKKIANLYATNFYFEEERWIYFDDLVREISISTNKKEELVKSRGKAIFKENGETHYINVLDFRTKSISSPMEIERAGIRRHILKRRVNNLRNKAKETILENVKEKYPITYY
ncbi:hypothetical protein ERX46_03475 [Brumimicrobium glaciale]|uniref:Peptidyl-prolyl cis-trans isomerase n=1 Tax=Brumimicrobium glaciale TaxID=200475 RepID=A0A4Q4KQZ7_9FLAO|nr:hypothetical protein [Brumimicrobium glaciale]RYM36068.1 hypothetical protein ERX46_03475 [Brumimicrobium glaciale]